MTPHDTRAQVGIGADTNPHHAAIERTERALRILILGDFGGHAAQRPPLAERRVQRVDRDGIDAAIAQIAPTLRLSLDPDSAPEVIAFLELDDFHPDRLRTNAPTLARLRELRTSVETQAVPPARQDAPAATGPSASIDTGSLLDRILESEAPLGGAPLEEQGSRGDDLSDFIRRAVRPHVAREVDPRQRALVDQVDDVLGATLRVLLHHPDFQALEALWRAVDFFLRRCDPDATAAIGLLDLSRDELALATSGDSTSDHAALMEQLSGSADRVAWSLVIAAYQFNPADAGVLARIARIAEAMGAPWLSAADARHAGSATLATGADPEDGDELPAAGWDDLRRERAAQFLALAVPAFLVRLPYGADNPIESMRFEELEPGAPAHDRLLWANPAFLCALIAATPVERGESAPSHGTIGGLPLHLFTREGTREALPCAEASLSERATMQLLARGLTPLVSLRDGDAIRIPRLQSIAEPPAPLLLRPATGSR